MIIELFLLIAMGAKTYPTSTASSKIEDTVRLSESQIDSIVNFSLEKMRKYGLKDEDTALVIIASINKMYVVNSKGQKLRIYDVSTSRFGVGNEAGSYKTPLGVHRIYKKIGADQPMGMIFKGRKPTGEIAKIETRPINLTKDYITSRILWLEGLEEGFNKGEGMDSKDRFIYIHGTAEEGLVGKPTSFGCIRMRNADVIELFDMVRESTLVYIAP